jgi:chemotaxis protein CheD
VWAQRGRLAVAHVLLPSARDGASKNKKPSRFADTVVPYLLEQLGSPERSREVVAYVAGGGTQFELSSKTASVGEQNRAGVLAALRLARIRVAAEDCGGDLPRQLVVDGPEASVYSIRYAADPEASSWELPHAFKEATTS